MPHLIPLLRRPPTDDTFTPPTTSAEFFQRYPGEIRSLLVMSAHERVVPEGQTARMLGAAIKPGDILLTKRAEFEIQDGDCLENYPRQAGPDATERDFLM